MQRLLRRNGVWAAATANSGTTYGVYGVTSSPDGYAGYFVGGRNYFLRNVGIGIGSDSPVWPLDVAATGARAISATTSGSGGTAIVGIANAPTGSNTGVFGVSDSTSGIGVYGWSTPGSGTNYGVFGKTNSSSGYAGYFVGGRNYFEGKVGIGATDAAADLHIASTASVNVLLEADTNNFGEGDQPSLTMRQDGGLVYAELGFFDQTNHFSIRTDDANGAAHILLIPDGRVGIKTTTPSFDLEVNGSAGKPGGGSWSNATDRRLKKNIRDLEGSLDNLLALRGVTYEYKDPQAINELPGERIGMIAQEVEEVFPDWVSKGAHGYKTLTVRGFEALTVEALRELRQEKERQLAERDAEIELLQNQNAELEARLARIEAMLGVQSSQAGGGVR